MLISAVISGSYLACLALDASFARCTRAKSKTTFLEKPRSEQRANGRRKGGRETWDH